jgi:hypothetical protein
MSISLLCPDGHPVELDESRLGGIVVCPRCLAPFHAELSFDEACQARAEKGRARPARDDDDDDDDDEDEDDEDEDDEKVRKRDKESIQDKPKLKVKTTPRRDDDEDDEEEQPRKKPQKKKPARKVADDDDDDEDDDDDDDDEQTGPLTKKQLNLQMVQLGLTLIMWAVICMILLPIVSFTQSLLTSLAIGADMPWIGHVILGVVGTSVFAIDVLMLIGVCMGFWAPRNAEVKSTIIGVLLFAVLMLFFILLGVLGVTGMIVEDIDVSVRFGRLFFVLAGICKFLFFLSTMVYLKTIAYFLKDILLASEPINILIEFTLWYVIPQVIRLALIYYIDFRNIDALTFIILGLFGLFLLFATIRSYFLLFRWADCVNRIRALVGRTIRDM